MSTDLPRFACPDWWERIRLGQTPMASVPLNEAKAAKALAFFNRLRLPDVAGNPPLAKACGDWFRDILCAFLASEDPETKQRLVWELLCMVPKKNSKTTYVAGLGLTALFLDENPSQQMLIVAPSQNIAERCFDQAQGMIRVDPRLDAIFKVQDHSKCITRRKTDTRLDVKTFDTAIVTGEIPILTIIDELHELGKKSRAAAVMQQIRGGGITKRGGQLLMITTQSDAPPAGIWKTELMKARKIRDGNGGPSPIMLPVLYEFPLELQKNEDFWRDQRNWSLLLPNLGRSIDPQRLVDDYQNNGKVNREAEIIWISQHLDIEIGIGLKTDAWPGAEFWSDAEDASITFESILARCEAVVVGIDGGGMDDLFGLTVLGRERETKRWLSWSHAWCHRSVLTKRQSIAVRLEQFEEAGDLTIIDGPFESVFGEVAAEVGIVNEAGVLASVALDVEGPFAMFVDELAKLGINEKVSKQLIAVPQGGHLMAAIKATGWKTQSLTLRHAPSAMMDWCVSNVKIEAKATTIGATKQNAGDAKIDPWIALQNAAFVMMRNPAAPGRVKSGWNTDNIEALMAQIDAAADAPEEVEDGRPAVLHGVVAPA